MKAHEDFLLEIVVNSRGGHCCWAGGRSKIYRCKHGSSKAALISPLELWAALHHRENGGTLGMVLVPLIINPIYTLFSEYLLGISPFKGLFGGVFFLRVFFSRRFQETTTKKHGNLFKSMLGCPGKEVLGSMVGISWLWPLWPQFILKITHLGAGFKHFLFSSLNPGEMIPNLTSIFFKRGSFNHQLAHWSDHHTWRIIPISKYLVTRRTFSPFGRGITPVRGLTNHGY